MSGWESGWESGGMLRERNGRSYRAMMFADISASYFHTKDFSQQAPAAYKCNDDRTSRRRRRTYPDGSMFAGLRVPVARSLVTSSRAATASAARQCSANHSHAAVVGADLSRVRAHCVAVPPRRSVSVCVCAGVGVCARARACACFRVAD